MKFFVPIVLFFTFLTSCAEKGNTPNPSAVIDSENNNGLRFFYSDDTVDFHAFNTKLPVITFDSVKTLIPCQRKEMAWFEKHQDEIFPKIKQKIFEYYKSVYPSYKAKWGSDNKMSETEIERYLPYPAFPDSLLGHIKPVAFVVHTSQHCSENSFSIEFDCTWDPQYGLGIYVENGVVRFASLGQKTYPN